MSTDNFEEPVGSGYEWKYITNGRVLHRLHVGMGIAKCGLSAWDAASWMGTGSQEEYETAASLPKCRNCLKGLT